MERLAVSNDVNRRTWLKQSLAMGTLAGGAGAAHASRETPLLRALYYRSLVPEVFVNSPRPPTYTPHLVIGSGFGGAITAHRLAEAGQQVTVLERGFAWPSSPTRQIFGNDTLPDGRTFWFKNKARMITGLTAHMDSFGGVMDATEFEHMTVWRGACVGDGSVIFTGVMIQPEQRYFEDIFKGSVDFAEMNSTYFPRVRQMLRLSPMPEDIYRSHPFGHSRAWDQQAIKAGYQPTRIDSLFNWNVIRDELSGRSRKSAIAGLTNHGNSNGAKFDLNQNYLKWAQASGKARVFAGQEVQGIGWDGSRYTVDVIQRSVTGATIGRYVLSCDRLYLAAGSVGSSSLLVKARAEGSLRNLNEHVGEGWGSNGDAIVVRSFSQPGGIIQGAPSASKIHDTRTGMPVTFENWYVPGVPVDVGILGTLGMVYDDTNRGRFVYDHSKGAVVLDWAANGNGDAFTAMQSINQRIAHASGTVPGAWPFVESVNGRNWTAHPLGGAVIGRATDAHGRVIGHPGLYVMDGALVPGSTGSVNPSLTIAALAERNIAHIVARGG
ncbi:GMC oxidoreductase [Acidovorax cavernicola]|nr:GMC oxidoreductase [Acidovorax cavernicola]